MRILHISHRQSWPTHSGAKLRTYHFARGLGRHAAVTHVFLTERGAPVPAATDFPFCREIIPLPAPKRFTFSQLVRGLVGRWPLPVLHCLTPEMQNLVVRLSSQGGFDAVHMDSVHLAPYGQLLQECSRIPAFYDWHNIESELMHRYARNTTTSRFRSLYAEVTARRLADVEQWVLRNGFGHIVCSEREREKLRQIAPQARIAVVPNGVAAGFYREVAGNCSDRNRLLFVGHMAYSANIEAATSFVRTIWPRIHEQFPSWTLTLAGSSPPHSVVTLARGQNVEVTGSVADLRPYYAQAVAAIVPLHVGSGTRLKILEAMAAGVPVISTAIGAEGLDVSPGENILIVDSEADWLSAATTLSTVGDAWMRIAAEGRRFACRFDWEILGESLWGYYSDWLGHSGSSQTVPFR